MADPGPGPSYRQVLRDPRLVALLAGDSAAKVGEGMSLVAVPLLALRLHGRVPPALAISLVVAAPYLLPVTLSLAVGLGRRRFDPRRVLVADAAVRSVFFLGVGLLALAGWTRLWSLTAGLVAGSVLRLLSASARRLAATGMAGDGGRLAVNGLLGTSDSLALYIAGPALGGLVAAAAGPQLVLVLTGLSHLGLLAAAAFAVPAGVGAGAGPAAGTDPGPARSGVASGWAILRRTPVALRLFVAVFVFDLCYGPVEVALPLLVTDTLGGDATDLGGLWTWFGLGALCGALLTNQARRVPRRALLVAIIGGWAGCVALLAAAPTLAVAGAALAAGGLIYGPFLAVAYTLLQDLLAADEQQPVLTFWAGGISVAAPLGLAVGGPLVVATGTRGGLLTSAVLTGLLVPAAAWWLRPGSGRPGPHGA